jgi:hypothetical protein
MEFTLPAQQSASLDKLLPAFAAAQKDYPDFIKNRSGQYAYMDLCEMMGVLKPILLKHELVVHHRQYCVADDKRILGTILYHTASGQYLESRSWITIDLNGKRSPHQEFGSAMSYHRRYEIMSLLNLTPEDESDNDGDVHYRPKTFAPSAHLPASDKQKEYLKRLLADKKISSSQFFEKHDIYKSEDLTSAKISEMIKELA